MDVLHARYATNNKHVLHDNLSYFVPQHYTEFILHHRLNMLTKRVQMAILSSYYFSHFVIMPTSKVRVRLGSG